MPWKINVANPSDYMRSDYVEINLERLGVPAGLDKNNLKLSRLHGEEKEEIPYQIDSVLGLASPVRILTFLSKETPKGAEDYSQPSATFILEEGEPEDFLIHNPSIGLDHYYTPPDPSKGDAPDGYNETWYPERKAAGVKIRNGTLEFHISLVAHPDANTAMDYSGTVTSLTLKDVPGDMLSPFDQQPEKHWGKIHQLAFFPVPWILEWFTIISLKEKDYELMWSQNGNIRSTITLRSQPITLSYNGRPYFREPNEGQIECYLYRVINSYPKTPYYMEDVFVLTKEGFSMSFKPYFESEICRIDYCDKKTGRVENIPDYFTFWNSYGGVSRGYGFASDGHARGVEISQGNTGSSIISWRLPDMHHNRCVNYFMFHGYGHSNFDLCNEIGHNAWYEKVFKPLEALPDGSQYETFAVAKRYIPLQNGIYPK